MSFVISKGNKILANSLSYYLRFEDVWFTYIYKMFPILIPQFFNMPFCAISFSSFGWQHLHSWIHSCFILFISTTQVALISNQGFWFFVEILSFGYSLVNFECDAHLAVDHSLLYSYPKMFLFFSLILNAWGTWFRIFLDSYLGFFLLVAPGSLKLL